MKKIILPLLVTFTFSGCAIFEDEFEYDKTPVANQRADLLDEERDGVINARDLCPGTPTTAELDNDGCGEYEKASEKMQLQILFANDSTVINDVFENQIAQMASFLNQYPSTSIELQGHASKTGDSEHNLWLSKERAKNVRAMLVEKGIDNDRIRTVGFGDTQLDHAGEDEVSHALNRRVTATVVGFKGQIKDEWTIFTTIEK